MSRENLQEIDHPLFRLGDNALRHCLSYLLPIDLCQLSQTTKKVDWNYFLESTWEDLTRRRWRVHERTRKTLSVSTWKQAFHMLHVRNQMPEGKFSGRLHVAFAQGSMPNQFSSWVMLGHGNNAMLRSTSFHQKSLNVIEVRVCLQNLSQKCVQFHIHPSSIRIVAFHSDEVESDELFVSNIHRIAFNGVADEPTSVTRPSNVPSVPPYVLLNPFDFAVFSCSVYCPRNVSNEPNFLTMIEKFEVSVEGFDEQSGKFDIEEKMTMHMMDDSLIWNMYTFLPSGVVLLKERPMVTVV